MVPTLIQEASGVQNITIGASSHASTALLGGEGFNTVTYRLSATSNCWYHIDTTAVAATTSNSSYLALGIIEYIRVRAGYFLTVIQDSASGTLNIMPMREVSTP